MATTTLETLKSTARPDTTYELEQTYKTIPGTIV